MRLIIDRGHQTPLLLRHLEIEFRILLHALFLLVVSIDIFEGGAVDIGESVWLVRITERCQGGKFVGSFTRPLPPRLPISSTPSFFLSSK
jgi:hypothetical protein